MKACRPGLHRAQTLWVIADGAHCPESGASRRHRQGQFGEGPGPAWLEEQHAPEGNFPLSLLLYRRSRYRSPSNAEELSRRLAEKVSPRDRRGFLSHLAGVSPEQPYAGQVNAKDCRIVRLPQGAQRLFEVDLRAKWEAEGDGCVITVTQKAMPWLWMAAVLGLGVASLSALGEYLDGNWWGALTWVGIFVLAYGLHLVAFRQVAGLNDEFLRELLDLERL